MSKFEVGQRVKCVDNIGVFHLLKEDVSYIISKIHHDTFISLHEISECRAFCIRRFVAIEEEQEPVLDIQVITLEVAPGASIHSIAKRAAIVYCSLVDCQHDVEYVVQFTFNDELIAVDKMFSSTADLVKEYFSRFENQN